MQQWQEQFADSPNTVISGSFLMRPSDGCGLSQTTEECRRNSPIEISVTWARDTRDRRWFMRERRQRERNNKPGCWLFCCSILLCEIHTKHPCLWMEFHRHRRLWSDFHFYLVFHCELFKHAAMLRCPRQHYLTFTLNIYTAVLTN